MLISLQAPKPTADRELDACPPRQVA